MRYDKKFEVETMIKNTLVKLGTLILVAGLLIPVAAVNGDDTRPGAAENMAANGVAVDSQGNVIVTGQVYEGGKWIIQTEKYAASDGHLMWSKKFSEYNYNIGKDVVVDSNDNVIVVGSANTSSGNGFDYCLIKYASDGTKQWHNTFHNGYYDTPWRVVVDNANNIFINGMSLEILWVKGSIESRFWMIKCSSAGTKIKDVFYDEEDSSADMGFGIAVDSNNNILVTGSVVHNNQLAYCTLKYDSDLNKIWGPKYYANSGENNSAAGVAVDSGNNIYVIGGSETDQDKDYLMVKYDSNGNYKTAIYRPFTKQVGGDVRDCSDDALGIAIDSQNNVVVTGTSCENFCTIKYNSQLNEVTGWPKRENFTGGAKDVAVDKNNNVIVTGYNTADASRYYTIKYSPTGQVIWTGGGGAAPPEPPEADFTFTPQNPTRADFVRFNDRSTGSVATRQWNFGDGSSSTDTNPVHQFQGIGTYTVTLTVTGSAGTDSVTKTVTVSNAPPAASFTYSPPNPQAGETISFDGSGSSDPDGSIASYSWSFGDEGSASGRTAQHSYAAEGTYTVTLTVTDNDGDTATATKIVTVNTEGANEPPVPQFSFTPSTPQPGQQVSFDASTSYDPDGIIELYQWDWESDGVYHSADESVNPSATHTWSQPGTYNVTLKVTDNNGSSNTYTLTVRVGGSGPELTISSQKNAIAIPKGKRDSLTVTVACLNASAGTVSLDVLEDAGATVTVTPASTTINAGQSKEFLVTIQMPEGNLTGNNIQLQAVGSVGVQSDIWEIQLTVGEEGGGTPGFAALLAMAAIFVALLIMRRLR
ncbi:MAG: PKD domain-containing protein [Candidatus Thermoplasmatota archaeon]|nr:PKD domain-containing protein [Candidatus Thermoplasmatota archaeon]